MCGLDHRHGAGRRRARRENCGRGNAGNDCARAGKLYGAVFAAFVRRDMKTFRIRRLTFTAKQRRRHVVAGCLATILMSASMLAQEAGPLEEASRPLSDGVPQVAVVRLRELLSRNLSDSERAAASAKLGEALVAAEEFSEALKILTTPEVRVLPAAKFSLAQAYAGLSRWSEALPLYESCAADAASPVRTDALFGKAETLRALGRNDEALQTFSFLRKEPRWSRAAEFRSVELLVAKGDTTGATLLLDAIQPATQGEI